MSTKYYIIKEVLVEYIALVADDCDQWQTVNIV